MKRCKCGKTCRDKYSICAGCKAKYDRKRSKKYREAVDSAKTGGCEVCGYNAHPSALDFHHVDPSTKSFTIGSGRGCGLSTLKAELKKTIVLCANCHRIHHKDKSLLDMVRRNWSWKE